MSNLCYFLIEKVDRYDSGQFFGKENYSGLCVPSPSLFRCQSLKEECKVDLFIGFVWGQGQRSWCHHMMNMLHYIFFMFQNEKELPEPYGHEASFERSCQGGPSFIPIPQCQLYINIHMNQQEINISKSLIWTLVQTQTIKFY